jgi:hypothetical protein
LTYYPVLSLFAVAGTAYCLYEGGRYRVPLVPFFAPLFFFTYFGHNFRPIWRPRYMLLVLPFFFLIAAIALGALVARSPAVGSWLRERVSIPGGADRGPDAQLLTIGLAVVLFVGTPVSSDIGASNDPHVLSTIEEPRPDYFAACQAISGQVHTEDVVITNRPQQLHFWLGKTDYRGNSFSSTFTWKPGTGHYTGAKFINNASQMKRVVRSHDRVWVVYNPFMPLSGKEWIWSNLELRSTIDSPFPDRFPHGLYSAALEESRDDNRIFIYAKGVDDVPPEGEPVSGRC